jgi:hypothetical protein
MMDLTTERILVTGDAGFLIEHLQQELLNRLPRDIPVLHGDGCDPSSQAAVIRVYDDMKSTVVTHFAAEDCL